MATAARMARQCVRTQVNIGPFCEVGPEVLRRVAMRFCLGTTGGRPGRGTRADCCARFRVWITRPVSHALLDKQRLSPAAALCAVGPAAVHGRWTLSAPARGRGRRASIAMWTSCRTLGPGHATKPDLFHTRWDSARHTQYDMYLEHAAPKKYEKDSASQQEVVILGEPLKTECYQKQKAHCAYRLAMKSQSGSPRGRLLCHKQTRLWRSHRVRAIQSPHILRVCRRPLFPRGNEDLERRLWWGR